MQKFSSKILLFGEYSVVVGGGALAIPFEAYQSNFKLSRNNSSLSDTAKWSNNTLLQFATAINKMLQSKDLTLDIDIQRLQKDLRKGLYLDSNIPKGYGLGSSAALVAGVVSKYAKQSIEKLEKESLQKLQQQLGVLESHFHGRSSGFDPLVCYLNRPILKTSTELQPIEVQLKEQGNLILFLVDTQLPRETSTLVDYFLKRLKEEPHFEKNCREELKPVNDDCIDAFLKQDDAKLYKSIRALSFLQWDYFRRMIPQHFREHWQKGLQTKRYILKLCGAGGGGCMLGIAKVENWNLVVENFGEENLKKICLI